MSYSAVEGCTATAAAAASQWLGRFGPQPTQQSLINGGGASGSSASIHTCVYEGIEPVSDGLVNVLRVCRSNTAVSEFVQYRVRFEPEPCGLVDVPDALAMSWLVIGAWAAAYAVRLLVRIIRDR